MWPTASEPDDIFPPLPPVSLPPPLIPEFVGCAIAKHPPAPTLSPSQMGIRQAVKEGDLEALPMAFSVTVHERVAPGVDPENPDGMYEVIHDPFPFKILKELKQAVQNYGVNSPFTVGIVQGIAEGNRLIPAVWSTLAKTVLAPGEFLQFRTWWRDHVETAAAHNQARQIPKPLEQLMGIGPWAGVQNQLRMEDQAIEQLRRCCRRAWEKIERKSTAAVSFQRIIQGPEEPYTEFIARLQEAIKRQITNGEAETLFYNYLFMKMLF
ncbi:endogenous retrovirus group K member 9 Gag polyprotein-like [Equus caballus]|uniref:endogenous retrovirus group K member 9 Gag polyprotein-like n=1 Tax=Equus caballus TaxID=9796 RepID=UPI0038B34C0A